MQYISDHFSVVFVFLSPFSRSFPLCFSVTVKGASVLVGLDLPLDCVSQLGVYLCVCVAWEPQRI